MEEWPIAIQRHTLDAAQFPVDIFDTAFPFGELLVFAGLSCFFWKEQGALEALGTVAVGMGEWDA